MTRPIDACSGCHTQEDWWSLSNVQVSVVEGRLSKSLFSKHAYTIAQVAEPASASVSASAYICACCLEQDFHTDTFEDEPLNSSLLTAFAEAHRCGCLPPKKHMWFHKLPVADACYSVTKGVDCDSASQTYLPWAKAELDQVKFFGLSATGYVQNRDMEVIVFDLTLNVRATLCCRQRRLRHHLTQRGQ
jgi:hypothetical protein